jgi:hypothetical protein
VERVQGVDGVDGLAPKSVFTDLDATI